jgi:hypothetical protein
LLGEYRVTPAELVLDMDGPQPLPVNPLLRRLLDRAQSPRGVWIVVAIAFALSLPALASGLSTDDHLAIYRTQHELRAWSLFALAPAEVASGIVDGKLAWWTSPSFHVQFFRPLATLSHVAEFQLWADAPWAMHLLNGLLYAALVAIAWLLYREIAPRQPYAAALAALMFAIDDGHAVSVGWISGRNTVLASMFALAAFWLHVRARATQRNWLLFASAGCSALALASAEAGLCGFGYFVAYVLVFERGGWWKRAASLVPQLSVLACWASIYIAGDFGVHGASLYRELTSPLVVLWQGVLDLPTWLIALLGPSGSSLVLFFPENPVRLVSVLLCLPLIAALVQAVPRTRENAFFALGALACLPPLFTTHPQDRLLMLASFGAFGLLASFICVAASQPQRFVRRARGVLLGIHSVLAPLLFIPMLNQTVPIEHAAQAISAAVPVRAPKQVILVNAPLDILNVHATTLLAENPARTLPESRHVLYAGASRLTARRSDARTLELVADDGWGNVAVERMFSNLASMPRVGSELALKSMQVLVRESTPDGRPKRVQFRFPTPLEAPDRLWLRWQGQKPVPWKPPAIGETSTFPPLYLFSALQP